MTVRVVGTSIQALVTSASDPSRGTYTLTGVPAGRVTLELVEPSATSSLAQDMFTLGSKRVAIDVTETTTTALTFRPVYHWREIAGYPPPYPDHDWATQWVSDRVGFMFFRMRSDPEEMSLWRTLDGGAAWTRIGDWVFDPVAFQGGAPYPSIGAVVHFSDADHGVVLVNVTGLPFAPAVGFFHTANGGTTWKFTQLPWPSDAYGIDLQAIDHSSPTHIVAAGTVGAGVQGYSGKYYDAIWESDDAGATWTMPLWWEVGYGASRGCTALGTNTSGEALAFYTGCCGASERKVARRTAPGLWTVGDDARVVVNTGYGPGDAPMVGQRAWVTSTGGTLSDGLYRSDDAGATWTRISDALVQYVDFASPSTGFALAGGWLLGTRDAGATWSIQAQVGGSCCHGPSIWAFGADRAILRESVFDDPNGRTQIFAYAEPPQAAFEIQAGVTLPDVTGHAGDVGVAILSLRVVNSGALPLRTTRITMRAAGSGDDAAEVGRVKLWWDRDASGDVGVNDTLLASGTFPADDAALTLAATGMLLDPGASANLLVTYDVAGTIARGGVYTASIRSLDVAAEIADGAAPVAASGPPEQAWTGRKLTVTAVVTPSTPPSTGGSSASSGCGHSASHELSLLAVGVYLALRAASRARSRRARAES